MAYNVFYRIKGDNKLRLLSGVLSTKKGSVDFCRHYIELMTGHKVIKATTTAPKNAGEVYEGLPEMTEEHKITLHADWIPILKMYRLHFPWDPGRTVGYADTIEEAIENAAIRGFKVKVTKEERRPL